MSWLKRGLDSGRPQDCDTAGAQARNSSVNSV
jgi:predicted metalloprotease